MATKGKTSVFGRLGQLAAAVALFSAGWGAHVWYQRLDQHVESSILANRLAAAEIQIDNLQAALEREKKENDSLASVSQKAKDNVAEMQKALALMPTRDDWTAVCTRALELHANTQRIVGTVVQDLSNPGVMEMVLQKDSDYLLKKLTNALVELQAVNKTFVDTLVGANALGYRNVDGKRSLFFVKNPSLIADATTGRMREDIPSTKPSAP
jgi:hypothetical protein